MGIERRKILRPPGTTNLRSPSVDRQDERTIEANVLGAGVREDEYSYRTELRRTKICGHCRTTSFGKTFQTRGIGTAHSRYYYSGALYTLAAHGSRCDARKSAIRNRRKLVKSSGIRRPSEGLALVSPLSIVTPLHLISDCTGFKGVSEVWAFRAAILELVQPGQLPMRVGWISVVERIVATVGCRNSDKGATASSHEISARMVSAFKTVSDEQGTPLHSPRLLGPHPEKRRNTVNPDSTMASRRASLCASSAGSSPK